MSNLLFKITSSDEPFLTTRELARKVKTTERAICSWAKRYPDFPCIALPGAIRIRLSDFAVWLEQFQNPDKTEVQFEVVKPAEGEGE